MHSAEHIPLVSFPKSGNTWMRFILANLFAREGMDVEFENIDAFTPTHFAYDAAGVLPNIKGRSPIFVKLHHMPRDEPEGARCRHIVYIYRNGFDAIYSHWHFYWAQCPGDFPNLETFLAQNWTYCGHWGENVHSWLSLDGSEGRTVHAVSYESMIADAAGVVSELLAALGHAMPKVEVRRAVERSSRDRMRELSARSEKVKRAIGDVNFVRSARTGDGVQGLSDRAKRVFLRHPLTREYMVKLGYMSAEELAALRPGRAAHDLEYRVRSFLFRGYRKVRRRTVGPWPAPESIRGVRHG